MPEEIREWLPEEAEVTRGRTPVPKIPIPREPEPSTGLTPVPKIPTDAKPDTPKK